MVLIEAVLEYEGKTYRVEKESSGDLDLDVWMWTEGNFGCDCNKAQFIQETIDGDFMKEKYPVPCGSAITLVSLWIKKRIDT